MQGGGWHEIPGAWKERMPKLPGIITGIKKKSPVSTAVAFEA